MYNEKNNSSESEFLWCYLFFSPHRYKMYKKYLETAAAVSDELVEYANFAYGQIMNVYDKQLSTSCKDTFRCIKNEYVGGTSKPIGLFQLKSVPAPPR